MVYLFKGGVPTSVLPNKTARAQWIQQQLDFVDKNYLDGINFDYEEAIPADQIALRDGYTNLVKETNEAFKARFHGKFLEIHYNYRR